VPIADIARSISRFRCRLEIGASSTSFRNLSVAALIAGLPSSSFFTGSLWAASSAAMSRWIFASATAWFLHGFAMAAVCVVAAGARVCAPHAVSRSAAQAMTAAPRITTPP